MELKKYKVFCDITLFKFFTDDLDEAKKIAANMEAAVYDNITGKLIIDYSFLGF